MFTTNLAHAICLIRDKVCPRNTPRFENGVSIVQGLLFVLDLQLVHYKEDSVSYPSERRRMYIAIGGNTNTFIAIEPEFAAWNFLSKIPLEAWDNTSNHDSCWRTDGMEPLTTLYFEMSKRIAPDVAPAQLTEHCYIEDFYPIEMQHVRDSSSHYRRILKEIKPV